MTVQVSDGSLTATLTVDMTVTAVNDAPVIVQGDGPLNQTILEDANLSLELNATDVDGDALSWSVSSAAGNGTAGVDPNTGEVNYHPNADFFGSDSFTVTVSDGALSDSVAVNLTVSPVNDAPVLADGPGPLSLSLSEDDSLSYDLNATDPEGDGLTWSLSANASNGNALIDASTGVLTYWEVPTFRGPTG